MSGSQCVFTAGRGRHGSVLCHSVVHGTCAADTTFGYFPQLSPLSRDSTPHHTAEEVMRMVAKRPERLRRLWFCDDLRHTPSPVTAAAETAVEANFGCEKRESGRFIYLFFTYRTKRKENSSYHSLLPSNKMVSRRRILSRSRDDLNLDFVEVEEEDVWFQRDKLFKQLAQIA
ncbi:hypothetical protein B566_EDAN011290 [Ephemera danica]|nr:hypothetical protein B566_EDAN011290 [Ephemera danica]